MSKEDLEAVVKGFDDAQRKRLLDALASKDGGDAAAAGGDDPVKRAEGTSSAFVFIKPHAVTDEVKALVRAAFEAKGVTINSEGPIAAEDIDKKCLIDTHYGSIAARCVRQKPADLVVQAKGQEEFEKVFGMKWADALEKGIVYNGADAAAKLEIDTLELAEKFDKLKKGEEQCKLGGGCYCGKISDEVFVINGFYYRMRKVFTEPGKCIHYYSVEWDSSGLSWGDFRGKLLGATDPSAAAEGSIRATIFKDWEKLGLKAEPDTGNNGVHASASPFEGLAERANWLGKPLEEDYFAKALVGSGVPLETVKAWTADPTVKFDGKDSSLFDLFEDMDGKGLLEKAKAIVA